MENISNEIDQIKEINRKLAKLEQRVIDLIVPIQNIAQCLKSSTDINYLIQALKGPIPINDSSLKILLKSFESEMRSFEKNIEKMNSKMQEHSIGEIKFIGNKLNEIDKLLKKLLEDQPKKKVQIEFSCDGYDLVKKPIGYDINEPLEPPTQDSVKKLLDSLPQKRWALSLIHRFGLLGEKEKTFKNVGKVLDVSTERAREIVMKSLRLCRNPVRRNLVENLPAGDLRKCILGEED